MGGEASKVLPLHKGGRQNTLVAALKHRSLPGLVCGERP